MTLPCAVIFGVGRRDGLGACLARRFCAEGRHVVVVGRTQSKLDDIVSDVVRSLAGKNGGDVDGAGPRDLGGTATPISSFVADAAKEEEVVGAFETIVEEHGAPDLVVYNADVKKAAPMLKTSLEMFMTLFRDNTLGGFLVGREAARTMLPAGGTLLFTGASASLRSRPPYIAFATAKTGVRALAQGMAREFGPKGLHVAHIVIDGMLAGDRARNAFPKVVEAKGDDELLDPDAIAGVYWMLHQQPRACWTHEMDLRPFSESF